MLPSMRVAPDSGTCPSCCSSLFLSSFAAAIELHGEHLHLLVLLRVGVSLTAAPTGRHDASSSRTAFPPCQLCLIEVWRDGRAPLVPPCAAHVTCLQGAPQRHGLETADTLKKIHCRTRALWLATPACIRPAIACGTLRAHQVTPQVDTHNVDLRAKAAASRLQPVGVVGRHGPGPAHLITMQHITAKGKHGGGIRDFLHGLLGGQQAPAGPALAAGSTAQPQTALPLLASVPGPPLSVQFVTL
jgi:hypothetical protein